MLLLLPDSVLPSLILLLVLELSNTALFFCDQAVINPALGHPFCLLCVECFSQS